MKRAKAERLLSDGARIVKTHHEEGDRYSINGGTLSVTQARALIRDMHLIADAGLFGDDPQSWGCAA